MPNPFLHIFFFKQFSFAQVRSLNVKNSSISNNFLSISLVVFAPIDRTQSGGTPPGQSGPGSNGNKEGHRFPQSSSIDRASPSSCFVSYVGGACGVMVIVVGNGHDDESSNPGLD